MRLSEEDDEKFDMTVRLDGVSGNNGQRKRAESREGK